MSSKSKSSVSEPSSNKASPATPRVSKLSRGVAKSDADSPSPLQRPRLSVDRSPRSVNSKTTIDRRTPKLSTTPDKQPTRVSKGPELHPQLSVVQEDLKKAKEKLVLVEKEKAQAIEELKEAQRLAEEANEKLREALVAQKRAEESTEIEKFRAVEIEQAGIEAAQKKEDEWQKELESVRNQHALDLSALFSTTQELQRVKQELAMTSDAKNQALNHADDATKIAEIHAEKMELLNSELVRVKALLDSKHDKEANEKNELVAQLNSEIGSLKQEVEKIKCYEEKLVEKEDFIDQLNVEVEAAKMAESYARNLAEECMKKVEALELEVQEANRLERSASESLESVKKKLEGSNDLLHESESEIAWLKEKVGLLEISVDRQRGDIEESDYHLNLAKAEAAEMGKKVECLTSELELLKEEKIQTLNNEKLAADCAQTLLEEKNKLVNELECLRDEDEKNKKAMESLTAALHEVSTEARETKEKLILSQADFENYEAEMENLKLVLKSTSEKYETTLVDAKHEVDVLTDSIELSKHEHQSSKAEWEKKELHLMDCVKQLEDEKSSMEEEISRLATSLKASEEKFCAAKDEGALFMNTSKEAETEVIRLKEALGKANSESMRSKENLLDKENELQSVIQENKELQMREAASLKKIEELSKLLEESMVRKQAEENGEISESEKDYDVLPKVVEFSEQNGDGREDKPKVEDNLSCDEVQSGTAKLENLNGNPEDRKSIEKEDDSIEVDSKMWESCKIEENEFSTEKGPEEESFEEGVDSKMEGGESYDHINGLSSTETNDNGALSPLEQQSQKKKKPLLKKFGSLLKKKGTNSQK